MTDFYARLEGQLVDAAARRAAQGHLRRAAAGRGRTVAALCAGIALVAGAAGVGRVVGESDTALPRPGAPTPAPAPTLRDVRVAVLNGTATSGVARGVADDLADRGATIDLLATSQEQTLARSVVDYRTGAEEKARRVASALGIARVAPITGEDHDRAPRADVVVRVGQDRCAGRPSRCATPTPGVP